MRAPAAEIILDPVWPWDGPGGPLALALVAVGLAALTFWTYAGQRRVGWRRVLAVLALRLGALLVACLAVLRPALADRDDAVVPSKLLIAVDDSKSMNVTDELDSLSRWDRARRLLRAPAVEAALRRLESDQKVEIVYYQVSEDARPFRPEGPAEGLRSDFGQWLSTLLKKHGGEKNLRGLVILSDGADNGTRFSTVEQARRWRALPCPVQTFALGSPTTAPQQADIAVAEILPDPPLVPVKTKLTVRARVDAHGLPLQTVFVELLVNGKPVGTKRKVTLAKAEGNEIVAGEYIPDKPGEMKVTVKIDPVQGEANVTNNEMTTYVTATGEGVSVLWVEGKMRFESTVAIRDALKRDKRFNVTYFERLKSSRPAADEKDWFNFQERHYDVIVIGDISASRFGAPNPQQTFADIKKMVREKGTGLLMMGGYETFFNSDWHLFPDIADLLPVRLTESGQLEQRVRMEPTPAGLAYVLRLADPGNELVWNKFFDPLQEITKLGEVRPGAEVFATGPNGVPVLVAGKPGEGRVLAFGGDTTHKVWRRNPDAVRAYERFWKQVILWLAKQEEAEGDVQVIPDTRRVAAGGGNRVGFTVRARGKGGAKVEGAKYTVKVIGPDKREEEVTVAREGEEDRGYFWRTTEPGEYVIEATARDGTGQALSDKPGRARFLAYAEDLESAQPAANHKVMMQLAANGGGSFHLAGEDKLEAYLKGLLAQPVLPSRARVEKWPDWQATPRGHSGGDQLEALWSSGGLLTFLLFAGLLCAEWGLRRRWGMV